MARPLRSSVRIGHGNRPSGWSLRTSGRRIVVDEGLCPFKRFSQKEDTASGRNLETAFSFPRVRFGRLKRCNRLRSTAGWKRTTGSHQRGGDSDTIPFNVGFTGERHRGSMTLSFGCGYERRNPVRRQDLLVGHDPRRLRPTVRPDPRELAPQGQAIGLRI